MSVIATVAALSSSLTARGDSQALVQEGINAYQSGQYDLARERFGQLINDDRWSFAALYNLGNVALRQKKMGEALAYYRRAIQKKPFDPDARSNIGFVLSGLGIRQFPGARGNRELFRVEVLNSATINQSILGGSCHYTFLFSF